MGLHLFPGSAVEAALPSGMGYKWVRFNGNALNIENKMASLSSIFPVGTGYNAGGSGFCREAKKWALPDVLARAARQERGIQTKKGRLGGTRASLPNTRKLAPCLATGIRILLRSPQFDHMM